MKYRPKQNTFSIGDIIKLKTLKKQYSKFGEKKKKKNIIKLFN